MVDAGIAQLAQRQVLLFILAAQVAFPIEQKCGIAIAAVLAGIRMAVYNACGVWINEFPFTPARVLAALKAKEEK